MENRESPGDRHNTVLATDDYRVSLSDLEPARGLTDGLDDLIYGLCDTSHTETLCSDTADSISETGGYSEALPASGLRQFCQHLRLTVNADTVYLCERQSLRIVTTTSADFVEDTEAMHRALTSMISNLDDCHEPFQLPDTRVFPDHARLCFTVIPVGGNPTSEPWPGSDTKAQYLAVIVDADEDYRDINVCITEAVKAMYALFTTASTLPTSKQLQRAVFDQLKRKHSMCSERITARRQEIFIEDLRYVSVHFEKLLSLNTIDTPAANEALRQSPTTENGAVWGWQAVASLVENDQFPDALYQQAELWGEAFTTSLDTHILQEAAFRYKEVCEAANLDSFDSIKPLCLTVYSQTMLQDSFIDTLQELIEMAVVRGSQIVLKLSEKTSVSTSTTETESELGVFNAQLQRCRESLGIQIGLSEFGTGHSSLLRVNALNPDVIQLSASLLPDRQHAKNDWADTVTRLSHVAGAKAANSDSTSTAPRHILVDGSQLPSTATDDQQVLFDKIDADSAAVKIRQSQAA